MINVVLLFLVGMAALAIYGRISRARDRRGKGPPKPATCPECGRYILGRGVCDCGKGG